MLRRLFPPGIVLACAALVCAADDKPAARPDPAVVRKLIDDLKSDDFETRDKAAKELAKLEEVPDALREATKSTDAEVRRLAVSAVEAIKARAEEKAFKAMVADLQKVEVDRFVSKMVKDADFAGDKQWEVVQKLTKAVTAKANEQGGKKFKVPDPDMKSLPMQRGATPNESAYRGQRILLNDPKATMVSVDGCVIVSAGPTPYFTSLSNSIVLVDGDFTGCTGLDNCLLIVRGNVGAITGVTNSIILATGECKGATTCMDSFYQVSNQQLRFTQSMNNVYVKSTPQFANNDKNGRVLDTDRGPLNLLKFSEMKKDDKPKDEKK
jgi:hypothetical protein